METELTVKDVIMKLMELNKLDWKVNLFIEDDRRNTYSATATNVYEGWGDTVIIKAKEE
jgi:hypothetical protein